MKFRVYLEEDEDGIFVATCPSLPGCVSQGSTRTEATANIREAIEGYLKSLRKHDEPGVVDWLLACPVKGYFVPIASESTDDLLTA